MKLAEKNAKVIATIRSLAADENDLANDPFSPSRGASATNESLGAAYSEIADFLDMNDAPAAKARMDRLHNWDRTYLKNALLARV